MNTKSFWTWVKKFCGEYSRKKRKFKKGTVKAKIKEETRKEVRDS